jgi:hypothetical protein
MSPLLAWFHSSAIGVSKSFTLTFHGTDGLPAHFFPRRERFDIRQYRRENVAGEGPPLEHTGS